MKVKILHKLFFSFSLLLLGRMAVAQDVSITANPGTSQNIVTGSNAYHVSENTYLESEIGAGNFETSATAINRIGVYLDPASALPTPTGFGSFTISFKEATTSTFTTGTYNKTGYTQVYTGTLNATATGWIFFDLTTPIVRTAGRNLSILFERLDGVARTAPVTFAASVGNTNSSTSNTCRRYNAATAPTVGTSSLAASTFRAAIRFVHVNPTDISVDGITTPASSCYTTGQSIGVTLKNVGGTTVTAIGAATVTLTISGANTASATLTNTTAIAPGATETLTFNNINLPNVGSNLIQALVSWTGDVSPDNDTLFSAITTTPVVSTYPVAEGAESNPLDYFSYLRTLNGSQAWTLKSGKHKNADLSDSLAPHGGSRFYLFDSWNFSTADVVLYSNCFSLPAAGPGTNTYNVSFWMSHDTSYATSLDSMYLVVSTDKGATWTRLAGFQRYIASFTTPGWQQEIVDLANFQGQTIQLGFEGVSQFGNVIGIDDITVTAQSTLPIKLVNLSGVRDGDVNKLQWTTASESNNSGFELQRSINGVEFSAITFVKSKSASGNSSASLNYDFTDRTAFAGTTYYRLKQIDKNGTFAYSYVISIKSRVKDLQIASIYPNPTVNNLKLSLASPNASNVTIMVTDLAGRVIMQQAAQLMTGDNLVDLNVKSLARGTYNLKVACANGCNSTMVRFVKQ